MSHPACPFCRRPYAVAQGCECGKEEDAINASIMRQVPYDIQGQRVVAARQHVEEAIMLLSEETNETLRNALLALKSVSNELRHWLSEAQP